MRNPVLYLGLGALAALLAGEAELGWRRAAHADGAGADAVELARAAVHAAAPRQSVLEIATALRAVAGDRIASVQQAPVNSGSTRAEDVTQALAGA